MCMPMIPVLSFPWSLTNSLHQATKHKLYWLCNNFAFPRSGITLMEQGHLCFCYETFGSENLREGLQDWNLQCLAHTTWLSNSWVTGWVKES
jgi:hypothetical protein